MRDLRLAATNVSAYQFVETAFKTNHSVSRRGSRVRSLVPVHYVASLSLASGANFKNGNRNVVMASRCFLGKVLYVIDIVDLFL